MDAETADIFGGASASKDGVILATGDLVEFVETNDANFGEADIAIGGIKQPSQDRGDILTDVSGFGVVGDIDEDGREFEDVAKEQFDEISFAAAGGSDEEVIAFGGKFVGGDVVEEDVAQAADVAMGHQGEGAAGDVLIDISKLRDLVEDLARGGGGEIFDKFKKCSILFAIFVVLAKGKAGCDERIGKRKVIETTVRRRTSVAVFAAQWRLPHKKAHIRA